MSDVAVAIGLQRFDIAPYLGSSTEINNYAYYQHRYSKVISSNRMEDTVS